MKNIFLIGDSITMGYETALQKVLGDDVKIWRTFSCMSGGLVENGRWTGYTLNNLARHLWLKDIPSYFDLVHWNNGIWDTVIRNPENGCFTSPEEYKSNLLKIAKELNKLTDNVVFATTIPPRTDYFIDTANGYDFPDRFHEDTIKYNQIAKDVLPSVNVEIEDLYNFVLPHREEYIREDDNTHLTEIGELKCAEFIAENIKKYL